MNQILAIACWCLCTLPVLSQEPLEHVWARRVGSSNENEKLWRMAVDEGGNVFVTGYFRGTFAEQDVSVTSVGGADVLLLKYSPQGELLWARSAGGPLGDGAYGVDTDKDGNVYITGTFSGLAVFGDTILVVSHPEEIDLPFSFVARYSPSGELVWVRAMEAEMVAGSYPFGQSYAVRVGPGGDLIICGTYASTDASVENPALSTLTFGGQPFRTCTVPYESTYVMRMDTLGNTEWVHTVGGLNGQGVFQSIAFDTGGNIWVGGNVVSNVGSPYVDGQVNLGASATTTYTGGVMRLSGTGDPISGFLLSSTNTSNVEDLIVAGNGDIYLSGWHRGSLFNSPSATQVDGFLMRVSNSGSPIWTKRLTGPGSDFFSGIATTTEPNEIVGGAYYFFDADLEGADLAASPGNTSALVRLDTMGTVLEVVQPEVLSGYSLIADVQSDLFGNFYLCGDVGGEVRYGPDTITCLSQDMYVAKLSPQVSTGVEPEEINDRSLLTGYPNPTDGLIRISGSAALGSFELLDAHGRLVRRFTPQGQDPILDLGGLAPGIYVLTDGQGAATRIALQATE